MILLIITMVSASIMPILIYTYKYGEKENKPRQFKNSMLD